MAELSFDPARRSPTAGKYNWRSEMTRYHWFVLIVAALGWVFDCLDQQLFNLARKPAMAALLHEHPTDPKVDMHGTYATSIFLIGWATGGIVFGVLGDRYGRARIMMWTILIYSIFTGLSAFSMTVWDFAAYRFLTGLGVGGEFAVGVALVAEVMPDRARPFALGLLQALSTVGNVSAALISVGLAYLEDAEVIVSSWRWMFVIGTLPALLAILVRMRLKEPERWRAAVASGTAAHKAGSLRELFGDPRWRRRAIVGMLLASAGVIGLWGIGFFIIDLNRTILRTPLERQARADGEAEKDRAFVRLAIASPGAVSEEIQELAPPATLLSLAADNKDPQVLYAALWELKKAGQQVTADSVFALLDKNDPDKNRKAQSSEERARRMNYLADGAIDAGSLEEHARRIKNRNKAIDLELSIWAGITSLMFNFGAFFGIYTFSHVTHRFGRRPTFAVALLAAMFSTAFVFWFMQEKSQIFWMVPLMGFCQISLFGGYAIYFPELFPTRLRSTGTSFCYNVGRYVAAPGPSILGLLTSEVFTPAHGFVDREGMRYAGVTMCGVFLLGLLVLPFAPETKGQPLPE